MLNLEPKCRQKHLRKFPEAFLNAFLTDIFIINYLNARAFSTER